MYRVNRRLSYARGDGRLSFTNIGAEVRVIPQELRELPLLRGFEDDDGAQRPGRRFVQQESAGELIVEAGQPAEQVFLIAHGKASSWAPASTATRPCWACWPTATTSATAVVEAARHLGRSRSRPSPPCTVLALPPAGVRAS